MISFTCFWDESRSSFNPWETENQNSSKQVLETILIIDIQTARWAYGLVMWICIVWSNEFSALSRITLTETNVRSVRRINQKEPEMHHLQSNLKWIQHRSESTKKIGKDFRVMKDEYCLILWWSKDRLCQLSMILYSLMNSLNLQKWKTSEWSEIEKKQISFETLLLLSSLILKMQIGFTPNLENSKWKSKASLFT